MKKIFLVLIAAAFVTGGSGLSAAQSSSTKGTQSSTGQGTPQEKQLRPGQYTARGAAKPSDAKPPCVDVQKGCQLGAPQVSRSGK
jgi:hypothetical protein